MNHDPPDADIAAIIEAVTDHLEYLMTTRDWPHDQRVHCWTELEAQATQRRMAVAHRAPKRRAGKMGG